MAVITLLAEPEFRAAEALAALEAKFRTQNDSPRTYRTSLMDTFDWRLFKDGRSLTALANGRRMTLLLAWQTGSVESRLSGKKLPSFTQDLPSGKMRESLRRVIKARRLLPRVTVQVNERPVRFLDGEGHTAARLVVNRCSATDAFRKTPNQNLPVMLRLETMEGFDESGRRIAELLENELGLIRTDRSLLDTALQAVGVEPGGYAPKVTLVLDPRARGDEAVVAIHGTLLDTVRANEDGVRRNLDVEFLHDLRVAVRRIRAAIGQFKGVLPTQEAARFNSEFKWLGSVTGPVRDLDVYLQNMAEYRADLPEAIRDDLSPLDAYLRKHHRIEHRRLVKRLNSKRYHRLINGWQNFLQQGPRDESDCPDAARPILDLASERIWAVYRRVYKRGRGVAADTPADVMHKLRIDCKMLRYLLEFSASLYPPDEIRTLVASLRRLQDNLGNYNDLEVQQTTLTLFAEQMSRERLASVGSLLAMGRLVEHLNRRQLAERDRFASCWGNFATRANRQHFRRLFKGATIARG